MSRFWKKGLVVVLGLCVGLGCDTQEQQRDFLTEAFAPPSGFTRTSDDGTIVADDADDWRTAPAFAGQVFVQPAFPNPTGNMFVTIPLSVQAFNAVPGGLALASLDPQTQNFVTLAELPEARNPGAYVLQFSPIRIGRRGLVRVFLLDGRGELVSYGDLFVE